MNALFSIYVWIVWTLHLLVVGPIVIAAIAIDPHAGLKLLRLFSRSALFFAGIRVVVEGREHVDWSRAHVLMGNHQSALEPFIFAQAIPHHMVGIEKQENFKIPVYGWLVRTWGNIPIDRANPEAARASIALAEARLAEGTSIAILPEGTRTPTGKMGAFKKGGFHLAINTGAEIVPFTFSGAYDRLKIGDWRVHPGTVVVRFHPPIATRGYGRDNMDELIARVREAIASGLKDEERDSVQPQPVA